MTHLALLLLQNGDSLCRLKDADSTACLFRVGWAVVSDNGGLGPKRVMS